MKDARGSRTAPVAFLVALVLAAVAYLPGVQGPYLLDDRPDLLENSTLHIRSLNLEALRGAAGSFDGSPTGRPLAMLSFAANYYLAGSDDPAALKAVNVVLHLLIGVALYVFTRSAAARLMKPETPAAHVDWVAAFASAAWLLHPLHVSTVLYTVQRMTILSALFVVLGCLIYLRLRIRMIEHNRGHWLLVLTLPLLTSLAVLSKENGALLPALALVVECTCLRFAFHPQAPRWLRIALPASLGVATAAVVFYLLFQYLRLPDGRIPTRLFSADERLLTEARVLWIYLAWFFLLGTQKLGFHHDDVAISHGLVDPPATLFAIAGWAVLIVLALLALRRAHARAFSFAVLWFLGAHLLESTTIPLELMFEHRNYVALVGPMIGAGILLAYAIERLRTHWRTAPAALAVGFPLLCAAALIAHARPWRAAPELAHHLAEVNPQSPRAWAGVAQALSDLQMYDEARTALAEAASLAPYEAGYALATTALDCAQGRTSPRAERAQLLARLHTEPTTAYTSEQFKNVLAHCDPLDAPAPEQWMDVLDAAAATEHAGLAALADYHAGLIQLRQGRTAEAARRWERVLERDPAAIDPHLELATLYKRAGNEPRAAQLLKRLEGMRLDREQHARLRALTGPLAP